MSVGWVAAGATLVSGYMGSQASKDAADQQAQSAADANNTQRYMYDTTRADNAPFLANGTAANSKLAMLLGISPQNGGYGGYSKTADNFDAAAYLAANPDVAANWDMSNKTAFDHWKMYGQNEGRAFTPNAQASQAATTANNTTNDPAFGSLLRNFTASDLNADPVYQSGLQFGLDEGTKGINRQQAATGSLLSGATLKALTKYGNDYGSTKAGDAFNRFNANKQQTFSMLSGLSGSGQAASGQVSSAGQNMANNVSQTQIGLGNARAASAIGQSNALMGGVTGGVNAYQNNQLYNKLISGGGSNYSGYSGLSQPYSGYNAEIGLA